jgi:hypothetical protein
LSTGHFLFCFKHISDNLGYDKDRNYVIDEVGGLNSIIKPSSNDLVNKVLLVAIKKLERMTPFAPCLVYIHFLYDPLNSRLP